MEILLDYFSVQLDNNVALQSRSTQSSTDSLSSTINAIDGNVDPNFWQGSCFSTKLEASPWLRVDLLATHKISHIMITNRGDCCANYIDGTEILVGDSLDNNGNNNQKYISYFNFSHNFSHPFSDPFPRPFFLFSTEPLIYFSFPSSQNLLHF